MAEYGEFQLNDIILDLPPEFIQIERQSFNHQWNTLRTRSSMKVKSGFSQITVQLKIIFTDTLENAPAGKIVNGFSKLRDLVSQFRVTPICYVENQYLRDDILSGDSQQNMALIVKELNITKSSDPDATNVLEVNLICGWFNYYPFSQNFSFVKDIFGLEEVQSPDQSNAWKLLYQAEQQKTDYRLVTKLDGQLSLSYSQFNLLTVKKYKALTTEITLLNALKDQIKDQESNDHKAGITNSLNRKLNNLLNDEEFLKTSVQDVFGNTSSMADNIQDGQAVDEVLSVINNTTTGSSFTSIQSFLTENSDWQPVYFKDGQLMTFKADMSIGADSKKYSADDGILLHRRRTLNFTDVGLLVNGITVSFRNILSTIPLLGHPYPTYQYIGSTDAVVSISFITSTDIGIRAISDVYSIIEDHALKFRSIPAGFRNIHIDNDIVNMCGIKDLIPEKKTTQTVPGSPGTYIGELILVDNPLNAETQEKITPGQSFTTSNDSRRKILDVLQKFIKLIPDAFKTQGTRNLKLFGTLIPNKGFNNSVRPFTTDVPLVIINPTNDEVGPRRFSRRAGNKFYQVTTSNNLRNQVLSNTIHQFAEHYGILFFQLGNAVSQAPDILSEIERLTDNDILGIDRLKQDLEPLLKPLRQSQQTKRQLKQQEIQKDPSVLIVENNAIAESQAQAKRNNPQLEGADPAFIPEENPFNKIVNGLFIEWTNFIYAFLDDILNSPLIDFKIFESAKDALVDSSLKSGSECYPDFPLDKVVALIQSSNAPIGNRNAYLYLRNIFSNSKLSLLNVNISSLINPDFYFFNHQNAQVDDIISERTIQSTIDGIKRAREEMFEEERDWFKGKYEENILGRDKADIIAEKVLDEKDDPFFKLPIAADYKAELLQSLQRGVAPNLLQGSLSPAISASINSRDAIETRDFGTLQDKDNIYLNYSRKISMRPKQDAFAVQHRFDTNDCLDILPEHEYLPNQTPDTSDAPKFRWPSNSITHRVTQKFGPRTAPQTPIGKGSSNHAGIDIAATPKDLTLGGPVLASADGKISFVSYSPTESTKGKPSGHPGNQIQITHANGYQTNYFHLLWGPDLEYWSNIFHKKTPISDALRDVKLTVFSGQRIASIGSTGASTAPHLHFEILKNGTHLDPEKVLNGDFNKSKGPIRGIDPTNDSLLRKSIEQFSKDLSTNQGYGLIRAYPAFKLYFIESDLGERKRFSFDDFFSYSAVKDIEVIKSRKIAADLCTITLTNISGLLSNRKFIDAIDPTRSVDAQGNVTFEKPNDKSITNTTSENPIASLMLQPGIQIELRLGFNNNPEELETVFDGQITEVNFEETDDLITIVCQSFATELVQEVHGTAKAKEFGGLFDNSGHTAKIMEELLASPECVHFGRWEPGGYGQNSQKGLLADRWHISPAPQDDNIWAPETGTGILQIFKSTTTYVMYRSTIWDVFQEMTLRHPSYIVSAVPYKGKFGPRMTLFFGLPDQLYFARDSNIEEDEVVRKLSQVIKDGIVNIDDKSREDVTNAMKKLTPETLQAAQEATSVANRSSQERESYFKKIAKQFAMDRGFIKPFRNYHVATSTLHIIENNISNAGFNTFNAVTLQYSKGTPAPSDDTGDLDFNSIQSFTLKADAGIPDEQTREVLVQYPNCVGYPQAQNYCLSLLFYALKEAYRGELVIIGNPKIKPYDIVYIFDEYTDMFGPIEVEQVVHRFSQETGFITEIIPDLVVHVNQHATLTTSDAMGLIAEDGLKQIGMQSLSSLVQKAPATSGLVAGAAILGAAGAFAGAGTVAAASVGVLSALNIAYTPLSYIFFNSSANAIGQSGNHSLFGLVGTFIGRKLAARTQLEHPFRFSPLVLNNKPMIGGLPNRYNDGTFFTPPGRWFKEAAASAPLFIDNIRDRLKLSNWFNPEGQVLNNLIK